jgi:membrane protein DedA with SNARE-associated domain
MSGTAGGFLSSLSSATFAFVLGLVDRSGLLGVFVLMATESATLPVPSEVVLPLAGYLVYLGRADYWTVVVVASAGSLVGTLVDYSIGHSLGRAAVLKYGRVIRLNEGHLRLAEAWFRRYGSPTVLFARFVPLIRTLVAFPAGMAKMNVGRFVAFSTVGIILWDAVLVYLGVLAGTNEAAIVGYLHSLFLPLGMVAIAGVIIFLFFGRGRRASPTDFPS